MTAAQSDSAGGTQNRNNGRVAQGSSLRLGTSTYSFWHFTEEKTPIEHVLGRGGGAGAERGRDPAPADGI